MNSRIHSLSARVAEIALEGSGRWKFVRVDDLGGRCEVCHLPLVFVAHLENELTGRKVTLGLDCLNRFVGFSQIKAQAKVARDLLELERTGRAVELLPLLSDLEKLSASTLLSERQRIQAGDFFRAIKSGRLRVLMDGQREWIEQMQAKLNAELMTKSNGSEQRVNHDVKILEFDEFNTSEKEWLGAEIAAHPELKLSSGLGATLNVLDGIEADGGFIGSVQGTLPFAAVTDLWLVKNSIHVHILGVDISFSNIKNTVTPNERIAISVCQPSQESFRNGRVAWFAHIESPFLLAPVNDLKRPSDWIPISRVNVAAHIDDGQVSKIWRWSGLVFRSEEFRPLRKKFAMSDKTRAGRTRKCEIRLRSGNKLSPSDIKFLQENAPELLERFNL